MNTWFQTLWFEKLVSAMRIALADSLSLIENTMCRLQIDVFVRDSRLQEQPESLSGKTLVIELAKAMARDRVEGRGLGVYEGLYSYLPPLRQIRDALFTAEVHQNVQIPPAPCSIFDGRIPVKEFWESINKQVFIITVDD